MELSVPRLRGDEPAPSHPNTSRAVRERTDFFTKRGLRSIRMRTSR